MFLTHLALTHFRNYRRLDLAFQRPFTLLQGSNAQGKTNLLEAIYFLATSKSSHTQIEQEVVDWAAQSEPIPYCQISGQVHSAGRELTLEVLFTPREEGAAFRKQVRVNGVPRRNMDLIGQMRAVLFVPTDVVLVSGSPGERRRYLDIALCQIDPTYCQQLARFQQVLAQRNSLLKSLREQGAGPHAGSTSSQLQFWDEKLVQHGSAVIARRHRFVVGLDQLARRRHADLTAQQEWLHLRYLPSFNPGHLPEALFQALSQAQHLPEQPPPPEPPIEEATVREQYQARLATRRERELGAGVTLYGPHRDDLRFLANGHDLRTYGSRGQQRTATLALKLAETEFVIAETGEAPVLLLDDVMSELDAHRRATLLNALQGVNQAILTTTDWADFSPEFRDQAQLFTVQAGNLTPY